MRGYAHLPVSVKVRLGWGQRRKKSYRRCGSTGCATELVVHGRTNRGYRAEHIDWQAILGEIRQQLNIPVIANGEIWTGSAQQCMAISGCDAVMIGRADIPNLSPGSKI
ncbi:tRNA-dihydrouridine synthase [Escherichia coli]